MNLRITQEGVILPVKITPSSSKNEIIGWHNGRLKIKIGAPPQDGEANRALIQFLSKLLQLPQSKIILLKGASTREKELLLTGCTRTTIETLLL